VNNLYSFWAPNIHPMLVHFPIGLLLAAVAVDVAGWALRCNASLRQQATFMYVLGTLTTMATYFTGRAAARTVWLPGMAQAIVKDHWDWAFRTVWFFAVLTIVRLAVLRPARRAPRAVVVAAFAVAGLVGVLLLGETGDRGGRLVYLYGVGTVRQ
jgi:uncharacterized membrane protein